MFRGAGVLLINPYGMDDVLGYFNPLTNNELQLTENVPARVPGGPRWPGSAGAIQSPRRARTRGKGDRHESTQAALAGPRRHHVPGDADRRQQPPLRLGG